MPDCDDYEDFDDFMDDWDGCGPGIIEMYQPYIDGKMELRECNMSFRASYVSGEDVPAKSRCPL